MSGAGLGGSAAGNGRGVEVEDASVERRSLLQRSAHGTVEAILEVELAVPLDNVGEKITVISRVSSQQGLEVELALRRDQFIESYLPRRHSRPVAEGAAVRRVGPSVRDALEDHETRL